MFTEKELAVLRRIELHKILQYSRSLSEKELKDFLIKLGHIKPKEK